MKHGLIRVAALTPDARVADLTYNCDAHIAAAKKAAEDGARILTFPALSLTGACLGDLYFSEALITAAERALARFIKETEGLSLLSAVGLPIAYGGRLYSATAVVYGGSTYLVRISLAKLRIRLTSSAPACSIASRFPFSCASCNFI